MRRLLPRAANSSTTYRRAPSPSAVSATTAAIPTATPATESAVRRPVPPQRPRGKRQQVEKRTLPTNRGPSAVVGPVPLSPVPRPLIALDRAVVHPNDALRSLARWRDRG